MQDSDSIHSNTGTQVTLLEKYLQKAIMIFSELNSLLISEQDGFAKGLSWTTNIFMECGRHANSLENEKSVGVAYTDFRNVFD